MVFLVSARQSLARQRKVLSFFSKRNMSDFNQSLRDELSLFPSVITLPLHWGQQDPFNHLNNVDWLRFIESGRIDYMYLLSLSMNKEDAKRLLNGTGAGFIVKSQECKYKVPITYPDTLTVATKIDDLSKDRFTFYTKTYSNRLSKLASESKVICVSYDHSKTCKSEFSEGLLAAIKRMETNPLKIHKEALDLPLRKYIGM